MCSQSQGMMMPKTTNTNVGDAAIAKAIQEIAAKASAAIEELHQHALLAKGSRDVTQQAREAQASVHDQLDTLQEKIKRALLLRSHSPKQLMKVIKAKREELEKALTVLAGARQIFNVGFAESPLWVWRIGDKTSTPELGRMVQLLISERPMTRQQLVDVTGANVKRIDGVLVEIRRGPLGQRVANLTPSTHATTYFLFPEGMKPAPLAKRQTSPIPAMGTGEQKRLVAPTIENGKDN